ncbi:creatininase family protein [Xenophilus arseniciresistens]|uniref:Creatininase family protein n=1 Tax=Xenophilus arseniciresistens TaxID=1283306 RepID=A0AAE3SZF6_9BURK|nr:creatininase family protein [Xenophilus arseniciresistens]MDA7417049.1 creatininase family protein [Xenophilus arseniciresistens]
MTAAPRPAWPRFWADLNTRDFEALDAARAVAVLPLGATEQHGPHLPLGVDSFLADGLVRATVPLLAPDLPALFLPTQTIGLSPEHARFAGTLTLSAETLIRMWKEIGAGVARAGLRKLVLFNAHGGHVGAMDIVARELREAHDLLVYSVSWFNLPLNDAQGRALTLDRFDVHAGESETAMMLALAPQLVRQGLARDFRSSSEQRARDYPILGNGRSAKLGWAMQDYHPEGAAGNAAAATAAQGQALIDAAARALAQLLAEVSRLPLDTLAADPPRYDGPAKR